MQEIECDPEQMLGDKGYDSEAVRREIAQRGGKAQIPSTASRKIQQPLTRPSMPCAIASRSTSHDDSQDSAVGLMGWVNAERAGRRHGAGVARIAFNSAMEAGLA
jgi:hypothetical protein